MGRTARPAIVTTGASIAMAPTARRVSAVVDLPSVSEPDDAVPIGSVVAEDLALARRSLRPESAQHWLSELGTGLHGSERVDELPGLLRTNVLTALAAERTEVRFLDLALPDRHGGVPSRWWALAQEYAAAGFGVLVQSTPTSARDLGATLDATLPTTPVVALRTRPAARLPEARAALDPASDRKDPP